MNRRFYCGALFVAAVSLYSCSSAPDRNHGPIVLGDSSTIVTETDPDKLQDMVTDLQPNITTADTKDSIAAAQAVPEKAPDTVKPVTVTTEQPKQQQPAPAANNDVAGLKADFKEVSVLIPNLNAKISGSGNLQNANGAVYSFISGNINGNTLKLMGTITKVSQRYQSVVVVKNDMGVLPLETLSITTSWEPVKGTNNNYRITDLDEKSLERAEGNRGTIQNAVKKAAQRRRMSRKKVEEWVSSVHNVRNTEQKPLSVVLRSVMWKIDGKDANGRMFSKQIRIDIPL